MKPSITVSHITKQYRLGKGLTSLREMFAFRKENQSEKYRWVVKDVNFELFPGESLGIIGPNGAGKTTILKILSKVTQPTSGEIIVNGRLSALIELGAGFHPDLTGRENIFLNGTILGMKKAEIKSRFDEIIDFAGIGDFLDTPVKRYSSGMYARLGFAIAAHVNPQVLLVDEVLAVGDFAFQTKCYSLMEKLKENGTAMILVSHNMDAVRRVCDRGLVMYRGEPIFQGTSPEAVVAYSNAIRQSARRAPVDVPDEDGISQRVMTFETEIENVIMEDEEGKEITTLTTGSHAVIVINVVAHKDVQHPMFSLVIRTTDGKVVYDTTTKWMKLETPDFASGEKYRVEYDLNMPLLSGTYEVSVDIASSNLSHFYDYLERAMTFSVVGTNAAQGLVDLDAKITFTKSSENKTAV
jgi:ABC-type polysaccharide/polyol phosphate transport system ATPase subunit